MSEPITPYDHEQAYLKAPVPASERTSAWMGYVVLFFCAGLAALVLLALGLAILKLYGVT